MADSRQAGAALPDTHGYFGRYGGRFVAETLMQPLAHIQEYGQVVHAVS